MLRADGSGLVRRGLFTYRKYPDGSLVFEGADFCAGRMTCGEVLYDVTDHLGSVRSVVRSGSSTPMTYDEYGVYGARTRMPLATPTSPEPSLRRGFTGKEDQQTEFGVPYTDFGARHYSPALRRWMVPDPLSEKYYGLSPYAYCNNSPISVVDYNGMDGRVIGSGTKEDPYIIQAVYIYKADEIQGEALKGLNDAITSYNASGINSYKDNNGNEVFYRYDLSSIGVSDVSSFKNSTFFKDSEGYGHYYGNEVSINSGVSYNKEKELIVGEGNNQVISIYLGSVDELVKKGAERERVFESVFIHEIGHNLGAEHSDQTPAMSGIATNGANIVYPAITIEHLNNIIMRMDTERYYEYDLDGSKYVGGRVWLKH